MAVFTKPVNNAQMVDALNDLIRLNFDVVSGYDKALDQLSDADQRKLFEALKAMHERHAHIIAERVRALGGAPVDGKDWRQWVAQGKTLLAQLGTDHGLWRAMQSNENTLREAYGKAVDEFKVSNDVVAVVNQVLDDGREPIGRLEKEASAEAK